MPMSADFEQRLYPMLERIVAHYGTPFHIYDETGIRQTGERLKQVFADVDGFREYFAVKALPNPRVLAIMHAMGFGFDCSSPAELMLSRGIGARGEELMFTSNNTARSEFETAAADGGCILNLDDISLVPKVPVFPELICFRYNPGPRRTGNAIIGNPVEAKYGLTHEQLTEAYRLAMARGARRFGLHAMVVSNERNYRSMVQTVQMLLELAESVSAELGIRFDFINMGGGLGIPYRPEDPPLDLAALGVEVTGLFRGFRARNGYAPRLYMESGRYMTGRTGRWWSRPSTARTSTGPTSASTPACRPSCDRRCTGPTTTSPCPAKRGCRPPARSTWSVRCARTTTSSPCSAICPRSPTAIC
jgi:diaminopimelate decarboxylase